MKFFKSAIVLGLVTSVFASPVPQDSSTEITKRLVELEDAVYGLINEKREAELDVSSTLNHLVTRATITDKKCPDNGITYTKADITSHVAAENAKTNPEKYGNKEGNKKLFDTAEQLYKVSLDNVARAVFSRKKDGKYFYRGLMEHDKGTGNGFHKCK